MKHKKLINEDVKSDISKVTKEFEANYHKEIGVPFTDSLTGLFNHGFFQIYLEREIKRYERYGTPFTLSFIDLDSFFFYNNRYGPIQGDRILKQIAGVIKASVRETDLAARYAGDVFSIILTETASNTAFQPLDRIRSQVEEIGGPPITVSVGIAEYPRDASNKEEIIQKSNAAVKAAKIRGKNRVYFFEEMKQPSESPQPLILVVDDDPLNIKFLELILKQQHFTVVKAENGQAALHVLNKMDVDLVLLDVMMPGIDGYDVCRRIKGNTITRMIPVILVTALDDVDSKVKGINSGADDLITKPINIVELVARTKSLINVKRLNNNLTSMENVLFSLAITVEAKDTYTQGHIERVANMAVSLGRKIGLSSEKMEALRLGGTLHDIGKIGVPGEILNKPGPLTKTEWDIMKTHPEIGYRICSPLKKNLGAALEIIRYHHEKLDGTGYPDGLKSGDISMVARIMAAADIYDALITDRPYRKAMSEESAFDILKSEAADGKLDKDIVDCLVTPGEKGGADP